MTTPEPILRAISSTGDTYDDPSEDLLFELFGDIERGDAEFFIVERRTDPSGDTYAQTIRDPDGSWTVERREGSPAAHFAARLPDLRAAHAVLTAWAFELRVPDDITWEQIRF